MANMPAFAGVPNGQEQERSSTPTPSTVAPAAFASPAAASPLALPPPPSHAPPPSAALVPFGAPRGRAPKRAVSDDDDDERQRSPSPGPPDPEKIQLSGAGFAGGSAGTPVNLFITCRDERGKRCTEGGDDVVVRINPATGGMASMAAAIVAGSDGANAAVNVTIADRNDGTYMATYTVPTKGSYLITVEVNYLPVDGSPFHVFFGPPQADVAVAAASSHLAQAVAAAAAAVGGTTAGVERSGGRFGPPPSSTATASPQLSTLTGSAMALGLGGLAGSTDPLQMLMMGGLGMLPGPPLGGNPAAATLANLASLSSLGSAFSGTLGTGLGGLGMTGMGMGALGLSGMMGGAGLLSSGAGLTASTISSLMAGGASSAAALGAAGLGAGGNDSLTRTVCVSNISSAIGLDQLKQFYGYVGTVLSLVQAGDKEGTVAVEFSTALEAHQALQTDGTVLGDKALVVVSPLASVPTPAPITPVMALQMQQIQQSQMAVLQQQQLAAQMSAQVAQMRALSNMTPAHESDRHRATEEAAAALHRRLGITNHASIPSGSRRSRSRDRGGMRERSRSPRRRSRSRDNRRRSRSRDNRRQRSRSRSRDRREREREQDRERERSRLKERERERQRQRSRERDSKSSYRRSDRSRERAGGREDERDGRGRSDRDRDSHKEDARRARKRSPSRSRSPAAHKKDASNGATAARGDKQHGSVHAAGASPPPSDSKPSTTVTCTTADGAAHKAPADTIIHGAIANGGTESEDATQHLNGSSNGGVNRHGGQHTATDPSAHHDSSTAARDDAMDLDAGSGDVIVTAAHAKESNKAVVGSMTENGGKAEKKSSRHGSASPERRHKDKERDRGEGKKHHHRSSKDKDNKEGKRDRREKEKSSSRTKEGDAEAAGEAAASKQDAVVADGEGV